LLIVSCAFAGLLHHGEHEKFNLLLEATFSSKESCDNADVTALRFANIIRLDTCLPKVDEFSGEIGGYFKYTCGENPLGLGISIYDCNDDSTCEFCNYDDGIDYKGCSEGGVGYTCVANITFPEILEDLKPLPRFEIRAYTGADLACDNDPSWLRVARADYYCDGGYHQFIFEEKKITSCLSDGCQNCQPTTSFSLPGFYIHSGIDRETEYSIQNTADVIDSCLSNGIVAYAASWKWSDPATTIITTVVENTEPTVSEVEDVSDDAATDDASDDATDSEDASDSSSADGTESSEQASGFGSVLVVSFYALTLII